MNGTQPKSIEREKDSGVTISNDLNPSQQCSEVVKKANKIIGLIGRSFEQKSKEVILTRYNSLVIISNTASRPGAPIVKMTKTN